jgi:hypothetical protein
MGWTLIGHTYYAGSTGGGVTGSVNWTGADLIIIHATSHNTPVVSDSKGNTWTAGVAQYPAGAGGGYGGSQLWWCEKPTVGSGQTFEVALSSGYISFEVIAFSGSASSPFDVQGGAVTATGPPLATGSISPSQNGELIITGLGYFGGTLSAPPSGFTLADQADYASRGSALAYQIQSAAAGISAAWTMAGGLDAGATIASFKAIQTAIGSGILSGGGFNRIGVRSGGGF